MKENHTFVIWGKTFIREIQLMQIVSEKKCKKIIRKIKDELIRINWIGKNYVRKWKDEKKLLKTKIYI